jgi:hypothetical protein
VTVIVTCKNRNHFTSENIFAIICGFQFVLFAVAAIVLVAVVVVFVGQATGIQLIIFMEINFPLICFPA